jgi:elongation factor Ts
MAITADEVRRLRELTGAGMMDCKRALEEAGGDLARAQELLRTKGLAAAGKRAGKLAGEGVVEAYVHHNRTLGVLIEVNCETDFVANTEEFRTLARDLAMQVAAADPWWVAREDVPQDVVEQERKIFEARSREEGKPDHVIPKIVEGRLEAFYKERCLVDQPFFKDEDRQTGDLIAEVGAKVGEKVEVRRFSRFVRGEDGHGG